MKVLNVITRMIVGGAQEHALMSALGQQKLPGYEVALVTGPETGPEGNLLEGFRGDLRIVYVPTMVRAIHPAADVRALMTLRRLFRAERPDVVHTHSSKAGVLGRMAARAEGVPLVVHTLHSLVFHDYQPKWVNVGYRTIKRTMVPLTDHYVSVSDNIRERAILAGIGPPERHSTIRSGFPTGEFVAALTSKDEARERLGLPRERVIVGVVARLFPLKGHDDILMVARRVATRHPDVLFVLAGSGPLREELQRRIRETGLDEHVVFLGRLPSEQMPIFFSSLDVLAHASLREGLARILPQGILAGVPIVCYRLDGAAEVVRDGINGFLVPARDLDALTDRLEGLIADSDLRARLGGVGRERIEQEYSVEEMILQLDVLYRRLLSERRSRASRRYPSLSQ